jgi:predicted MFS family arabinose efflux permease
MGASILGNFFAGTIARIIGYRPTIVWMCLGYFLVMFGAYCVPRDHTALLCWLPFIGFFQGIFALFTMYLPPLFPTLLRTTGAGFSYNIGRTVAAFGTVFFGLLSNVGDYRTALMYASFLFLPAAFIAQFLPHTRDR